jgi:hypothetical protein
MDRIFHKKQRLGRRKLVTCLIGSAAAVLMAVGATDDKSDSAEIDNLLRPLAHRYGNLFYYHAPSASLGIGWASGSLRDDAVYLQANKAVESQFAAYAKGPKQELVLAFRHKALTAQADGLALFKWGCAALLEARDEAQKGVNYWFATPSRLQERGMLMWLLSSAHVRPGNYAHVRLRFLLEGGASAAEVLPIAESLLRKDPNDDAVYRMKAHLLSFSKTPSDLETALAIAKRLLAKEPNRLTYVGLLGGLYTDRWLKFGNHESDRQEALKWLRKYVAMAPRGCSNSVGTLRDIANLEAKIGGRS